MEQFKPILNKKWLGEVLTAAKRNCVEKVSSGRKEDGKDCFDFEQRKSR
jgi:hypothetical protein